MNKGKNKYFLKIKKHIIKVPKITWIFRKRIYDLVPNNLLNIIKNVSNMN